MSRQVYLKLKAQRFGVGRPVIQRAQVRRRGEEMRALALASSIGNDQAVDPGIRGMRPIPTSDVSLKVCSINPNAVEASSLVLT